MIALYKEIREVVQEGTLYRLLSPRAGEMTAVQYISKDSTEVLFFVFLHSSQMGGSRKTIRLRGLDEKTLYQVDALPQTLSGTVLMYRCIEVDIKGDFESRLLRIRKV